MFDYVYNAHTPAKSAYKVGFRHLQCKVMDASFLLQMFANTERYILSMEVVH